MAMFSDFITDAQARSGNDDASYLPIIKSTINFVKDEICSFLWDWQIKHDYFATIAPYSTGTADVTLNSTTVTITTGVVTAGMAGRKFKESTTNVVYRISSVNTGANTLTLDQAYKDTSNATATYSIFQDEYIQPYDCMEVLALGIENELLDKDVLIPALNDNTSPSSTGEPDRFCKIGNSLTAYYSTGTVTIAGTTLTLAGGTWPSDCAGMWVQSATQGIPYLISSRTNDTVVELDRSGFVANAASYQLEPAPRIIIRLTSVPDAVYRVDRWYYKQVQDMVNNTDITELPRDLHKVLIDGVYLRLLEHSREFNQALLLAKTDYEQGIYRFRVKEDMLKAKGRTPRLRTGYEKDITGSW